MTDRPSARMKQRLNIWLSLPVAAILIYTVATIFSVSIKDGKKWQSLANAQQLKSTAVSASRGTIYDSNGTVLSQSATVYTVYADPLMLKEKLDDNDKKIEELKGYIAKEDDASKKATYQQRLDATKSGDECLDELVEFLALNLAAPVSKNRMFAAAGFPQKHRLLLPENRRTGKKYGLPYLVPHR